MKKLSILFLVTIICSGYFAKAVKAEGRHGIQFDSGSNLEYIYYGENYKYATGFSLGHKSSNATDAETQETSLGVFARHNTKLLEKTYLGMGLSTSFAFGKRSGADIGSSYSVAPYLIIDYHLSNNFVFNAGVQLIKFKQEKLSGSDRTTTYDYLPTFFSLTYLF